MICKLRPEKLYRSRFVKGLEKSVPNTEKKQMQRPWGRNCSACSQNWQTARATTSEWARGKMSSERERHEPDHTEIGRPWWVQCDLMRQSLGQCKLFDRSLKKNRDWAVTQSCLVKIIANNYWMLSCLSMDCIRSNFS